MTNVDIGRNSTYQPPSNSFIYLTPLEVFELLCFAVFRKTTVENVRKHTINTQPDWTNALFKGMFMVYMLVSVVVLMNLLTAMMSDTYQRIQAQSDTEWKYGLAKLIQNMHHTLTTPPPLNLVTTWFHYVLCLCKKMMTIYKRPNLVQMIGLQRSRGSARSKVAAKWLTKVKRGQVAPIGLVTVSGVPLNSLRLNLSLKKVRKIENVTDWEAIAKKYRILMGEVEEPVGSSASEDDSSIAENESDSGHES